MSTVIQTADVPAADRLDFVRDISATVWVPMDFRTECQADFRGEFRASGLGPMQVVRLDMEPVTVRRTPELIARADPDLLKLVIACDGSFAVEQDGRQALLSPGDFAFYDTRRPYEVVCGTEAGDRVRALTFMFPPSLLPLPRGQVRRLAAARFRATAGVGELTSQFLLQLARNVDRYSPAEAARLSSAALEVLATRMTSELDAGDWDSPEARRKALLTTVQGFIVQHLGDPGLSPDVIAAAHHMSLRSLQQLFHDAGLAVAGWIRQRRLEYCRRDLADPALASRPVAAIASRWGFSSASDFSRAFRAAHGLPPAQYRSAQYGRRTGASARDVEVPAP